MSENYNLRFNPRRSRRQRESMGIYSDNEEEIGQASTKNIPTISQENEINLNINMEDLANDSSVESTDEDNQTNIVPDANSVHQGHNNQSNIEEQSNQNQMDMNALIQLLTKQHQELSKKMDQTKHELNKKMD